MNDRTHESRRNPSFNSSRRGFLAGLSVVTGAAAAASILPAGARAGWEPALATWRGRPASDYTFIDEALGNYPAYAGAVGFGRGHLMAARNIIPEDGQLFHC